MSLNKIIILIVSTLIILWASINIFNYFTASIGPQLEVFGLENDKYYAGDISCTIKGNDRYKVSTISIDLDNKPLVTNFKISKKEFEYPIIIPTKNLAAGKHELKIELKSGSYKKGSTKQNISFIVDNSPLAVAFVKGDTDAKVFQGRTLHIQFQTNKPIKSATATTLSASHVCFAESPQSLIYECFIPVDCETVPNEYLLNIHIIDNIDNSATLESKFQVVAYPFKKQSLKFDAEKLKTENECGLAEKLFEDEIEKLTANSRPEKLWKGVFYTPTEIKESRQITTEFGVMRTTQERGLCQHKAIDIYNTPKSVIIAPQDGIVVLKNRYAHSGNTVVIDHGYGILSLFFHLDTFSKFNVGDKIKKGNPVGTLGKTGYATGYHLHWEMRINNIAVDPLQWTKQDF